MTATSLTGLESVALAHPVGEQTTRCQLSNYLSPSGNSSGQPVADPVWETPQAIVRSRYGTPQGGHTYVVTSVAYSPDGQFLLSGSRDKTLNISADAEVDVTGWDAGGRDRTDAVFTGAAFIGAGAGW